MILLSNVEREAKYCSGAIEYLSEFIWSMRKVYNTITCTWCRSSHIEVLVEDLTLAILPLSSGKVEGFGSR